MDQLVEYLKAHWQPFAIQGLRIAGLSIGAWIAVRVAKGSIARLQRKLLQRQQSENDASQSEDARRIETLARLLEQAAVVGLWSVAIILVLGEAGIAVGPLLAGAGIAGVAIGFGAQNLVRDVISGFFLILENQVRVGDAATVNGASGVVERITLRTIVLRDASGTVHVFPNGLVSNLSNGTTGWSACAIEVGVSYGADTDAVLKVMKQVGEELKNDARIGPLMIADIELAGIDRFAESSVVMKGRIRTKPGKAGEVKGEYLRRVKKAFAMNDIEMPYPQRVVHTKGP